VTAKFLALARMSAPVGVFVDPFPRASAIASELDSASDIWHIQEAIEELETEFGAEKNLTESETLMRAAIVASLYDRLKLQLQAAQEKEVAKLDREMRIDKYFQPSLAAVAKQSLRAVKRADDNDFAPPAAVQEDWENEAVELLAIYQTDTDQVQEVRRRVCETSAMLSVLSSKAMEQQELAVSVLGVANESIGYVEGAEEQLNKAQKHNDSYKLYLVVWFWLLSFILWILHFLK
jgi:hypothetical protein